MFQCLENRIMFAANVVTLTITGTAANDVISLSQSGNTLTVVKNGVTTAHALSGVTPGATPGSGNPWSIGKIVVKGLGGNDKIQGNNTITRRLEIFGGPGSDTITGGAASDLLCGGSSKTAVESGNDAIYGGGGNDEIHGSLNGNNMLYGQGGNDLIYGYNGHDTIGGGDGNDSMYGGAGNDSIRGNNGNDVIHGQAGNDNLFGDNGNDSIYGGAGNDSAWGGAGHDRVYGGDGNDALWGDAGNDMLLGENGGDRLYGGADADFSFGGAGDDVIVSIGGSQIDNNYGEAGNDSFWVDAEDSEYIDASASERNSGRVHRVSSFMTLRWVLGSASGEQAVSRELNGQFLIDPWGYQSGFTKKNFKDKPLFADNGPTADDIFQGAVGDCYFVAPLSALAKSNPNKIRQLVADLGDGTYAVHFKRNGQDVFVRVDADLYVKSNGALAYAGLGQQQSLWAPIVEKAWAFFRDNKGTYDSIAGGNNPGIKWYDAMNLQSVGMETELFADAAAYLTWIKNQLAAGKAVVVGGPSGFASSDFEGERRGQHIYMANKVNMVNGKPVSIELRDPYGSYITIEAQHLFNRSGGVRTAW